MLQSTLFLVIIFCISPLVLSHRCAYKSPSPSEVIKSPRLLKSTRKVRNVPERFHIHHVLDESINKQPDYIIEHIKNSLIPNATAFWTANLRLKGGKTNGILLERACIGASDYKLGDRRICTLNCAPTTKCGEAIVPKRHLFKCQSRIANVEQKKSPKAVLTDFILYISAVNSTRCVDVNTVAYAVHCQQDSTNRPIAGNINICPNALSIKPHDQELLVSTIKHEIAHALVFSDALYPDFPTNPIKMFERDWPTKDGQVIKRRHYAIMSPKVLAETRKHFNCSDLLGAELEDQGGFGTALVHWEKRLFENEAMTGTHTQDPIYSRITLALFEDSGWYDVLYDDAEDLKFGKNLGCDFAKLTCGEWIKKQEEKDLPIMPYCRLPKHDGQKSLAVTRCSSARNALSFCNLVPYNQKLPPYYQYFDHLPGISDSSLSYYGGSVELSDYCPFFQAFTWRDPHSENPLHRDSRCELEENMPTLESNTILEVYGRHSACFDLSAAWTERRCSRVKTYTQFLAGCYAHFCFEGRLHIQIANQTRPYTCYFANQKIQIRQIVNGWLREGYIVCPPCSDFCENPERNQTCAEDSEPPDWAYVEDEPLSEPCFASVSNSSFFLLSAVLFVAFMTSFSK
ncbi:hypothetical protein M3Y97_00883400 [Aphelenchoides bicaudatus]|nr:hypothetical protein M3Y97_00883400 [Aphelenchoides bicaudatus]